MPPPPPFITVKKPSIHTIIGWLIFLAFCFMACTILTPNQ